MARIRRNHDHQPALLDEGRRPVAQNQADFRQIAQTPAIAGHETDGAVDEIERVQAQVEDIRQELEKAFMDECYRAIGVEFPERGYLLFWQLPLDAKLNYFDIEPKIADLKNEEEAEYRRSQLFRLVKFLGSDPIEKIDRAFQAKYESPVLRYLGLER